MISRAMARRRLLSPRAVTIHALDLIERRA